MQFTVGVTSRLRTHFLVQSQITDITFFFEVRGRDAVGVTLYFVFTSVQFDVKACKQCPKMVNSTVDVTLDHKKSCVGI